MEWLATTPRLLDALPDGVVVIDEQSVIRYANRAISAVFGHSAASLPGKPLSMLQPERFRRAHSRGADRYMQTGARRLDWSPIETMGLHQDGHEIALEITLFDLGSGDGRLVGGVLREVGQRRRGDKELRAAVAQLSAILESSQDGLLVVDAEGRITRFNQRFVDLWDLPRELLDAGRDDEVLDLVLAKLEDPAAFEATIEAMRSELGDSFEVVRLRDGRVYERSSKPQLGDMQAFGRVWSFRDISERVRAESMQAALHRISEAAHSAPDLSGLFAQIHGIVSGLLPAQNLYFALYDSATDQVSFPYFIDEFDPAPPPRALAGWDSLTAMVLRTGEPLLLAPETMAGLVATREDVSVVGTDGVDWLGIPLKTAKGTIGVLTVQSYSGSVRYTEKHKELLQFVSDQVAAAVERKQAQQFLLQSEERFRSVFDQSPIIICLLSFPEGLFQEMNAAGLEAFGFGREEVLGRNSTQLNVWVDLEERQRYLDLLLRQGSVQNFEARMRRRNGEVFTVLYSGSLVRLGDQAYSLNSLQDINERKMAEASLQESEEQFKSAFDHSSIGMALVARDGRFMKVNSCLCRIVGYSEVELLQRTFQDVTHPDDLATDLGHVQRLLAGEIPSYTMEKRYFHRDGSTVLVNLAVSLVRDKFGNPRHFISQIEDVTERRRAEQWQRHYADTLSLITAEATTTEVLHSLVRFAETQSEGMICSILLLSSDGRRLMHGAAPGMPDFYNDAIDGTAIGPEAGSCGAAAFTGRMTTAEDIMEHPNWAPWRELAERAGVRACWSHPVLSSGGRVLGTFAVYRRSPGAPRASDIDLIRSSAGLAAIALERAQHHEDRRLAKVVFEQSLEGIMVTDLEDRILMVNRAFQSLTGFSAEEVVGQSPRVIDPGRDEPAFRVAREEALALSGRWSGEVWGRKKSGEVYPLSLSVATVCDAGGATSHYISILSDVSDQKIQAARIEQLAFYDSLTGLPNRALFLDRLEQTLAASRRHGGHGAILFLDLDRFKEINDSQGHAVGDLALVEVARRFQAVSRKEETLARLGGDEFVLIAENADHQTAVRIASRLQRALSVPLDLMGQFYSVGASIGIAFYPTDGQTSEDLIKRTDIAMYRAKASGGGYRLYQPEMGVELEKRLSIAKRLGHAMDAGELQLYYQPQIDLASGRVIGAEALLRWNDSTLGWISPADFIPIAEERGMMGPLGDWVLREACRQVNAWAAAGMRLDGKLAINVSALQLEDPGIVGRLMEIVHEAGLEPDRFELELTESSMMVDPERAVEVMELLSAAGFGLSIDDFGTGYSSLAYLKRFAADQIKIDISFVRNMLTDANDHTIVTTIIAMARSLGLQTTAEGVEESGQAAALLALGCDFAQGYHFGRPESPQAFQDNWLAPARDGVC